MHVAQPTSADKICHDAPHASLYCGQAKTAWVRVTPDDRWPRMFRLLWPDGQLSDMANLARIKDAAIAICSPATPGKDRRRFHWQIHPRESRAEGAPVRFDLEQASSSPAAQTPLPAGAGS